MLSVLSSSLETRFIGPGEIALSNCRQEVGAEQREIDLYIYIDESGIFSNPEAREHVVSAVAAIAIPEAEHDQLMEKLDQMTTPWGFSSTNELKGRKLDEKQVSKIVTLLTRFDVVLVACIVDLGIHEDDEISTHKMGQAGGVTSKLTPEHHPNLVKEVHQLADRIRALTDQLYLQAVALTEVVSRVIQACTLQYSQSNPAELAAFRWRLDAKADAKTEYEQVWSMIVKPILQSKSISVVGFQVPRDLGCRARFGVIG
jgi:hypothetical protein